MGDNRQICSIRQTATVSDCSASAALEGELDCSCAPAIENSLVEMFRSYGNAIVDLGRLRFVDVAGITSLHNAAERLRASGTLLKLVNVSPWQRKLIGWCGWNSLFEPAEDCGTGGAEETEIDLREQPTSTLS